jgi:hypothetical protein
VDELMNEARAVSNLIKKCLAKRSGDFPIDFEIIIPKTSVLLNNKV